MYACDPVELASITFVHVFAGTSLALPVRDLSRVDEITGWLAGVDMSSGLLGSLSRQTWEQLQPYTMESVCLWQQGRVAAARTTGSDHVHNAVVMLRRGEALLRSTDPVRTLGELLDGPAQR